jgi:RHS repeat-associated protein
LSYEYNEQQRPTKVYRTNKIHSDTSKNNASNKSNKTTKKLIAEYRYNRFGERIKKVVYSNSKKPTVTYYLYDGHSLTAEANESGKITAQYLYYKNQPFTKLEGKKIYALHTDNLGTPRAATDNKGNTVWAAEYSPFGKANITNQQITLNLRFPGQYEDAETGKYYNYLRTYDPDTGRYVTSDPIGLAGGNNLYAYVGGNPLNKSDPLGLYTVYWGGAGLNGSYIDDQVNALINAGLSDVHKSTSGGTGGTITDANAVLNLRRPPPIYGFLNIGFDKTPPAFCSANATSNQINYIGYSYGSLLAAHTAYFYANKGFSIDNLVLIGSPISQEFLNLLRANKNIKNIIIKDLGFNGDRINAGMTEFELALAIPGLAIDVQTSSTEGKGHFYYAPNTDVGKKRRRELADDLKRQGLK